jgi:O-antigen ligase
MAVDREGGIEWLIIAVTVVIYFWCARCIVSSGQARHAIRAVAACGGVVAAIGLAQHIAAPRLLYGIWRPVSPSAENPFGPFVNRNDMAAWMVMALPLVTGYLLARLDVRRREGRLRVETAFDATGVWTAVAVCAMAAVLAVTLSRSGLVAGVAGAASIVVLGGGRMERHGRAWLVAGIAGIALVAAAYANFSALMFRVGETVDNGLAGRREIWALTWQMIRDFPLAGVGVGSFARAMAVYQPPHLFAFNHAHDEYLQLAAEGGVLMGIPALCAIAAAAASIAAHLRSDHTPTFWIRAGATSALAAIAVQNVWETGLRMPANAVLCALCAAIALHESATRAEGGRVQEREAWARQRDGWSARLKPSDSGRTDAGARGLSPAARRMEREASAERCRQDGRRSARL